jgi:hypothetical protein
MISSAERERIIQENSKLHKRIIDLDDQLKDGMPYARARKIRDAINLLEDIIFYNEAYLEGGVDND